MAHNEEVARWFYDHREAFNLRITECSWTKTWMPGLSDLRVTGAFRSTEITGSGIARSPELALQIAMSEFFERSVCIAEGIASIGVASHVDAADAKESASAEIVEHTAVAFHHLVKLGGRPCSFSELSHGFEYALAELKSRKAWIDFFELTRYGEHRTFLAIGRDQRIPRQFGVIFGSATSTSSQQAIDKAFTECLINLVSELENPLARKLTLEQFHRLDKWNAKDHVALYKHPSLATYSFDNASIGNESAMIVSMQDLPTPSEFKGVPLVAVRAITSQPFGKNVGPIQKTDSSKIAFANSSANNEQFDLPIPKG